MLNLEGLSAISRSAVGILPFTLFFYALSTFTSMAGMEIFGWLSALLVLIVLWSNLLRPVEQRPPFPSLILIDGFLVALLIVTLIGAFFGGTATPDSFEIAARARWILLFFLLRTGLAWIWSENLSMILDFLIGLFTLVIIYSVIQHFSGVDLLRGENQLPEVKYLTGQTGYRVSGLFKSSVTWGHSVALFIGFPAALFFLGAKRHTGFHWAIGASVLLALVSVVFTFSFGAWVAVSAALLTVALYSNRLAFVGLIVVLAGIFAGIYSAAPEAKALIESRVGLTQVPPKANGWEAALKAWSERPLLGSGFGEGGERVISNAGDVSWANTYLEWLVGGGSFGLIFYVLFIFSMFLFSQIVWRMIPSERPIERAFVLGAIASQVALHTGGFFDSSFKDAEVNHMFLFCLALIWALYNFYAHEHGLRIVRPKSERSGF